MILSAESARVPWARLGLFYFCFFAVVGAFQPYWTLYLQAIGLSPADIGTLMAVVIATRILAPNVWGAIADRTGARLTLVRWGALMMTLTWIGVFFTEAFWPLAAILFLHGFFQNAVLPQFEAVTMAHLGDQRARYSRLRIWGSLGFIATGTGLGLWFQSHSVLQLPAWVLVCGVATVLAAWCVPDHATPRSVDAPTGLAVVLRQAPVLSFFAAHFLLQLSHAPYYTFYSIHLSEHGYSSAEIGWLWGVGVVAEIAVFWVMHRLLPAVGLWRLMQISLLLAAVRWGLIGGLVDVKPVIWLAQGLHAASFGTFHAAAMLMIYRHFGAGHQGQGQALYSMLWGLGVALGSWAAGQVWSETTSVWVYASAGGLCVVAWALLTRWPETVSPENDR